ncbi:MAG: hypothetical protein IJ379_07865 [Lachnospiraceae bacterium]|nr:hypothetical protein [Lachnospiraceae bacterium]MBQ7775823.1 hypothetical protein [Lachnospiraceae bacterium]
MMEYNRYGDITKFVTDSSKLKIEKGCEVYISSPKDYDIVVDLEECQEDFEELKPRIAFWTEHICELDNIAQRFCEVHSAGKGTIDAHIAIVCIDKPDAVELVYWGDSVNTEFVVEFQHEDGKFVLKSFGRFKDIPRDWEKQGEFKL